MIKKQYLKSKPVCKVTFTLPKTAAEGQTEIRVVGDFNNWNWDSATIMQASKTEFKATIELTTGRNYEFRYMMANGEWENDWSADAYVPSPFSGIDNSVVSIEPQVIGKKSGEAAPKAKMVKSKPAKKAVTKKAAKDNLKKIEGIGPKIEGILQSKGIATFGDLAKAKQNFLKEVLLEAGNRFKMHDPSTWPEQAKLAANGSMEKLEQLQAKLKGGKR